MADLDPNQDSGVAARCKNPITLDRAHKTQLGAPINERCERQDRNFSQKSALG
jgi:hypothetical protein